MENLKTRALLVSSEDGWEGLWIDKQLYNEGHSLEEGYDRGLYFLALAEIKGILFKDIQTAELTEAGNIMINKTGRMPDDYATLLKMISFNKGNSAKEILSEK